MVGQAIGKLTPDAKEAACLLSLSVADASSNTSPLGGVLGISQERQVMPCTGSGFLHRPEREYSVGGRVMDRDDNL